MQGEVSGTCAEETGEKGMLEALMDRCAAQRNEMVLHDGDYVAFRRRGFVYALNIDSRGAGLKKMIAAEARKAEGRKEADRLAEMIKAGSIAECAFRSNGPTDRFCIASFDYRPDNDTGREYEIPEAARWARSGRGKIRFYRQDLPKHKASTEDRRRKYHAIPDGAVKARRVISGFEWLMPGDSGSYVWERT